MGKRAVEYHGSFRQYPVQGLHFQASAYHY
nr:MAG TPA: hypothetical protein [Caudoviricetes sp.]DAO02928.1 MAG TPA: hypothetical protein [Caudoviricetes sp.]